MLLMIDNYDSFTFNLVHYFREIGQIVEVYRNDQITLAEIAAKKPQYIVISPGPCTPDDAGISLAVIKEFAGAIPILGVCLGHQCIAQHFGAEIVKAEQVMHGKISVITHDQTGLFLNLKQPLTVTRYHSLVVKPETLPAELMVTASCDSQTQNVKENKKNNEIMALQHKSLPISSVQFHPESVLTEQGKQLLKNFLAMYNHLN